MNIYVKTKNKIYGMIPNVVSSIEYCKDDIEDEGAYCIYYFDEDKGEHIERDELGGRSMDCVWDSDVVKTAHSIEELCDEYVWDNGTKPMIIKMPKKLTQSQLDDIKNGMIIYAAIWTDHGLIYVARMNEKGDLELL